MHTVSQKIVSVILTGLFTALIAFPGFAEELITIRMALWDIPENCKSSDIYTDPKSSYYDSRWAELSDKFHFRVEYIPIKFVPQPTDAYKESIRELIYNENAPDVMLSAFKVSEYQSWFEDNRIQALPQDFEASYPNIASSLSLIRQRDAYKVSGQYIAIPRILEGKEPFVDYLSGFYYRKDLAQEAGVEIKDSYSIDELYMMFEQVQRLHPEMTMFHHIWTDRILQLGLIQAVPALANGDYGYDSEKEEYVWNYSDENILNGIKNFKQFYEAGFLYPDFADKDYYEARALFAENQLFSYFDGFDHFFLDQIWKAYAIANPDSQIKIEDIIGYAYLTDRSGNIQAIESGNSWSEYIITGQADEAAVKKFLEVYDFLLSDEGIRLYCASDAGPSVLFFPGAIDDSRTAVLGGKYSPSIYDTVDYYWSLRKNSANLKVLSFNNTLAKFYDDCLYDVYPMDVIYDIVRYTNWDEIDEVWNAFVLQEVPIVSKVIEQLNLNK